MKQYIIPMAMLSLVCSLTLLQVGCAPPLSEAQMHGLALAQSAQKQLCLLDAGLDPGAIQECLSRSTGSGEGCLPDLDSDRSTALRRCLLTEDARIQAARPIYFSPSLPADRGSPSVNVTVVEPPPPIIAPAFAPNGNRLDPAYVPPPPVRMMGFSSSIRTAPPVSVPGM